MQPMSQAEQFVRADAFETTFLDMEPMLKLLAWKFASRTNCDIDDVFSDVQAIFADLYISGDYDPDRGSFKSWVHRKVWYKLIDMRKGAWKRQQQTLPMVEDVAVPSGEFPFLEWFDSLPEDASILLNLILNCHDYMTDESEAATEAMQELIEDRNVKEAPRVIRRWAKQMLKAQGWCGARITGAFRTIKYSLA